MIDIVERLRGGKFNGHDAAFDLMIEAAEKIDYLRDKIIHFSEEIADLTEETQNLQREVFHHIDERERLEEENQKLTKKIKRMKNKVVNVVPHKNTETFFSRIVKALEGK
jgi:chromosome segregation ATPase